MSSVTFVGNPWQGLGRTCGTCTMCCRTHKIEELAKPRGKWCGHCTVGQGCGIYEARPGSCRGFYCLWLLGAGGDEDRPDRTKVVIDTDHADKVGPIVRLFEAAPGAFSRPRIRKAIKGWLDQQCSVLLLPLPPALPEALLPVGGPWETAYKRATDLVLADGVKVKLTWVRKRV